MNNTRERRSNAVLPRESGQRLGEMLVSAGRISRQDLEDILDRQRRHNIKIGQYLVEEGVLAEEELLSFLADQLKIDRFDRQVHAPEPGGSRFLPEDTARELEAVPLRTRGRVLLVASTDPSDLAAMDEATVVAGMDVEPVLVSVAEFIELGQEVYGDGFLFGGDSGLESVMQELESADVTMDETEDDEQGDPNAIYALAEDAPVVRLLNSILLGAIRAGASDIHLEPRAKSADLRFRIDGVLNRMQPPPRSIFWPLVSRLKLVSNMDIAVSRVPQDGRFTFRSREREFSIRTSTFPTLHGEKVVLRLLDQSSGALTMDQLGLAPAERERLEDAAEASYGMILATGPTGSGKTTLLYSLLGRINDEGVNTVTLEDPVEYRMAGVSQAQLNHKAGMTFASGLRAILRQDPDVIMVGEIRDPETMHIAVEAALTGHKVLSTLHTNDAPSAVVRLLDMGADPYLVSSTLLAVAAQRLVRRICPACAESYPAPKTERELLGAHLKDGPPQRLWRGKGCAACGRRGYQGRVGVYEVLAVDEPLREMIVSGATPDAIRRSASERGFASLSVDAAAKAAEGTTTFEEFLRVRSR